jgi:pimeloyl-ACP methyl ester carboxylesterase
VPAEINSVPNWEARDAVVPRVDVVGRREPGGVRAVVVVLHGGRARGYDGSSNLRLAYRRMLPFARALDRGGRAAGLATWVLRYRYRGWNEPARDPVIDARWALEQARTRHPEVPVVLLGHSMGARAALRVAGDRDVAAVCALAPWLERGEPYDQLRGRSLLIAHGDRERTTSPALSYQYALAARTVTDRVCRFEVHGDGHAMLRRARDWTWLVCRFVLGEAGIEPEHPIIGEAMDAPVPDGLRVPLRRAS